MPALEATNWIDWIIVVFCIFYLVEGWRLGFIHLIGSLSAYAVSVWVSYQTGDSIAHYLVFNLGVTKPWSDIIGFLLPLVIVQIIFVRLIIELTGNFMQKFISSVWDNILGTIAGLVNALVVISIFCSLLLMLPVRAGVKQDVNASIFAPTFIKLLEKYGGKTTSSLETVATKATKFITVKPNSNEIVYLKVNLNRWDLFEDKKSEDELLRMINSDRLITGQAALKVDDVLTQIARNYSRDMFEKKYFSHTDLDGNTLATRLKKAVFTYNQAAENIVYSPDVPMAHRGLMESASHRSNILNPEFRRVGIGVINGSTYGLMITQVFAD
ncbi:CvpA family protein [Patescibacteria group bacterium]